MPSVYRASGCRHWTIYRCTSADVFRSIECVHYDTPAPPRPSAPDSVLVPWPRYTLAYVPAPGCPSADTLIAGVDAQVGGSWRASPDGPTGQISVRMKERNGGYSAFITIAPYGYQSRGAVVDGRILQHRTLEKATCNETVEDASILIAMYIEEVWGRPRAR